MFCNNCGKRVPDQAKFCQGCGTSVAQIQSQPGPTFAGSEGTAVQQVRLEPQPAAPTGKSRLGIVLGLVLVAAVALFAINRANQSDSGGKDQPPVPQQVKEPVIQHRTSNLPEKTFTIAPGRSIYYTFTIPAHASSVLMEGRFTATGGSGNDVEVFLLDQDGLTNWQNRHQAQTFYNSHKVTAGTVHAPLPSTENTEAATYYLVFNNGFSLFSNKVVESDIHLSYDLRVE